MVHIVHGLDEYLIKKNIKILIKKMHQDRAYHLFTYSLQAHLLEDIINEIKTISLFAEHKVIVINDEHNLWEKFIKNEKFADALLNHNSKVTIFIKSMVLNFKINKDIINNFKILKINNYTKMKLQTLIKKVCCSFKINITSSAINFLIANLPNDINIFLNELGKLRNFNELVTLEVVKNIVPLYFENNNFKTIQYFLMNDYKNFWINFNYYNVINYDKINLINFLIYQLQLMRDIKILINYNQNFEQIAKALNISQFQIKLLTQYSINALNINNILLKLYKLDYNIKKGNCNKNIAIDLFFLNS